MAVDPERIEQKTKPLAKRLRQGARWAGVGAVGVATTMAGSALARKHTPQLQEGIFQTLDVGEAFANSGQTASFEDCSDVADRTLKKAVASNYFGYMFRTKRHGRVTQRHLGVFTGARVAPLLVDLSPGLTADCAGSRDMYIVDRLGVSREHSRKILELNIEGEGSGRVENYETPSVTAACKETDEMHLYVTGSMHYLGQQDPVTLDIPHHNLHASDVHAHVC